MRINCVKYFFFSKKNKLNRRRPYNLQGDHKSSSQYCKPREAAKGEKCKFVGKIGILAKRWKFVSLFETIFFLLQLYELFLFFRLTFSSNIQLAFFLLQKLCLQRIFTVNHKVLLRFLFKCCEKKREDEISAASRDRVPCTQQIYAKTKQNGHTLVVSKTQHRTNYLSLLQHNTILNHTDIH